MFKLFGWRVVLMRRHASGLPWPGARSVAAGSGPGCPPCTGNCHQGDACPQRLKATMQALSAGAGGAGGAR